MADFAKELGAAVCGAPLREAKAWWRGGYPFCENLANITNPDGTLSCPYHSHAFREQHRVMALDQHRTRPRKRASRCTAKRSAGYRYADGRLCYFACTRPRGHSGRHVSPGTWWLTEPT